MFSSFRFSSTNLPSAFNGFAVHGIYQFSYLNSPPFEVLNTAGSKKKQQERLDISPATHTKTIHFNIHIDKVSSSTSLNFSSLHQPPSLAR